MSRKAVALGHRKDGRPGTERREHSRGCPSPGHRDDGIGSAARSQRHRGIAQCLRMIRGSGSSPRQRSDEWSRNLRVANHRIEGLHSPNRIAAHRRLAGQHDRIDALVHGMSGIADLGARGPGFGQHRLKDLRCNDHWYSGRLGPVCNLFLDAWDLLERHLQAQIAARDHHAITRTENVVQMVKRFGTFDLGDEGHVGPSTGGRNLAGASEVGGSSNEAQSDHIDTNRQAELQIFFVLRRQGVG